MISGHCKQAFDMFCTTEACAMLRPCLPIVSAAGQAVVQQQWQVPATVAEPPATIASAAV
jgi:hypothetical protein